MARLHFETPELPGIPILTLCTVLDDIIAALPEAEREERERCEDLWHQQGVYVDHLDAQGFLHLSGRVAGIYARSRSGDYATRKPTSSAVRTDHERC